MGSLREVSMKKSRQLGAFGYRMRLGAAALLLAAISPAFAAEPQHDAFYFLSQMNKASAVMVVEQGIVPKPLGAVIAKAVRQVIADGDKPGGARSGDPTSRGSIPGEAGRISARPAGACSCATTSSRHSRSSTRRARR